MLSQQCCMMTETRRMSDSGIVQYFNAGARGVRTYIHVCMGAARNFFLDFRIARQSSNMGDELKPELTELCHNIKEA